jgi:hypothetical protein
MMAHQCPAKAPATGEMDMDLSHGIARTIFAALKDFAKQSGQNELSDSKLMLLGFSGTGVLFARLVVFAPERGRQDVNAEEKENSPRHWTVGRQTRK